VINSLSSMTSYAADVTDNENFGLVLDMQVTISVAVLDTTKTKPRRIHSKAGKPVEAEMLAKRWMIPARLRRLNGGSEHAYTLQCPPNQCVDDLSSHTCGWSAQGFLPYSKYDVNGLILYGRYQGPLATGHRLVGLRPAMLSKK